VAELRWGVFLPQGWRMDLVDIADPVQQFETIVRCAREAEAAGFHSVWLYDHFHTVPRPSLESCFECWTATAALARETSRIRLGQMVTCNSFRQPSLLAKMASCVDVMSGGRVIVGVGAGWYRDEYEGYGFPYPDTPERLRQLREAVEVLRRMWTEDRATFEGQRYRLSGAINQPKPLQRPHPPLWIGGGGERVTLRLVAQTADGCNVGGGDPDVVRHKLGVLGRHCEALGRDPAEIVKSSSIEDVVIGDPAEVARVERDVARRRGIAESDYRERYHGAPEAVAGRIQELVDAGIDYVVVYLGNVTEPGAIERFAREVFSRVGVRGTPRGDARS